MKNVFDSYIEDAEKIIKAWGVESSESTSEDWSWEELCLTVPTGSADSIQQQEMALIENTSLIKEMCWFRDHNYVPGYHGSEDRYKLPKTIMEVAFGLFDIGHNRVWSKKKYNGKSRTLWKFYHKQGYSIESCLALELLKMRRWPVTESALTTFIQWEFRESKVSGSTLSEMRLRPKYFDVNLNTTSPIVFRSM